MPIVERRKEGSGVDDDPGIKPGDVDGERIKELREARAKRFKRSQDGTRPLQPNAPPGFSTPEWDQKNLCWKAISLTDNSVWNEWDAERSEWFSRECNRNK
jgi:hypothetical protein